MVFLLTMAGTLVTMLALAGPALAQTTVDQEAPAEVAAQTTDDLLEGNPPVTVLSTELTGEQEVPGPGDPDGSGQATVIVIPPDTVCYVVTAQGIEPATAAHIHEAPADEAGPVVAPLEAPTYGASGGCFQDPELVSGLQENPEDYYVNAHNEEYPAGAIRGQLG